MDQTVQNELYWAEAHSVTRAVELGLTQLTPESPNLLTPHIAAPPLHRRSPRRPPHPRAFSPSLPLLSGPVRLQPLPPSTLCAPNRAGSSATAGQSSPSVAGGSSPPPPPVRKETADKPRSIQGREAAAEAGEPLHPMGMAPPRLLPGLVPPPSDWLPCTSWSPRSLSRAVDSAPPTASSPRCAAVRVVPLHRLVLAPPLRCGRLCSSDGVFSELQLPSSLLHQVDSPVVALAGSLPPRRH
jgi:hypothetical protein